MRYRNSVTGGTADTDRELSYPWVREHVIDGECWCDSAFEPSSPYDADPAREEE